VVDETDIRPTVLYLAGLHDDYMSDGRVIGEVLSSPGSTLGSAKVQAVGQCYKQLNSSVGIVGTSTLQASTAALESTSSGDQTYLNTEQQLAGLEQRRDVQAERIKEALDASEFSGASMPNANGLLNSCEAVVAQPSVSAADVNELRAAATRRRPQQVGPNAPRRRSAAAAR
jgi:hypothetical protein